MRFFTTIQFQETDFYRRVSLALADLGHSSTHVAISRRSAGELRASGLETHCLRTFLPQRLTSMSTRSWPGSRAVTPSPRSGTCTAPIRSAPGARSDGASSGRCGTSSPSSGSSTRPSPMSSCRRWGARRCARSPTSSDATVAPRFSSSSTRSSRGPCGSTPTTTTSRSFPRERSASHDRGARRGRDVHPRLHLVGDADPGASPLGAESQNLRDFARHTVTSLTADRDNEYLRPSRFVSGYVRTNTRRIAARRHYEKRDPSRPFVYFPLHVTEDFKVKRVIPHCADQEYIVKQVADALPQGLRPRPQGAPGLDRPEPVGDVASPDPARERPPRLAVHELARADPRGGRRHRHPARPSASRRCSTASRC